MYRGVPVSVLLFSDSAANLLGTGTRLGGKLQQGRPTHSFTVPTFVSTFALPSNSMWSFVSSTTNICSSQSGAICDVDACSVVQPVPLLEQSLLWLLVPEKHFEEIISDKYIDLSELLAVNFLQKEPEPQLLLDEVSFSHPSRKDNIARLRTLLVEEAFSIFALIPVTHFPQHWKDLMQYQLLNLHTFCHFSRTVWLTHD